MCDHCEQLIWLSMKNTHARCDTCFPRKHVRATAGPSHRFQCFDLRASGFHCVSQVQQCNTVASLSFQTGRCSTAQRSEIRLSCVSSPSGRTCEHVHAHRVNAVQQQRTRGDRFRRMPLSSKRCAGAAAATQVRAPGRRWYLHANRTQEAPRARAALCVQHTGSMRVQSA